MQRIYMALSLLMVAGVGGSAYGMEEQVDEANPAAVLLRDSIANASAGLDPLRLGAVVTKHKTSDDQQDVDDKEWEEVATGFQKLLQPLSVAPKKKNWRFVSATKAVQASNKLRSLLGQPQLVCQPAKLVPQQLTSDPLSSQVSPREQESKREDAQQSQASIIVLPVASISGVASQQPQNLASGQDDEGGKKQAQAVQFIELTPILVDQSATSINMDLEKACNEYRQNAIYWHNESVALRQEGTALREERTTGKKTFTNLYQKFITLRSSYDQRKADHTALKAQNSKLCWAFCSLGAANVLGALYYFRGALGHYWNSSMTFATHSYSNLDYRMKWGGAALLSIVGIGGTAWALRNATKRYQSRTAQNPAATTNGAPVGASSSNGQGVVLPKPASLPSSGLIAQFPTPDASNASREKQQQGQ